MRYSCRYVSGLRSAGGDAKAIFGKLFTLVTLDTTQVDDMATTSYLLPVSVVSDRNFVKVPSNTFPTSNNVVRIFNSLAILL